MTIDERYMRIAIDLAKKAEGMTNPNPIVGAVIVKDGKMVGKGYHRGAGLPHAEVNALRQAGKKAEGATLYVSLEPCDHFGRTPPCTDAVIRSGIRKAIIGMKDPNPVNNGRGIKKLKRNGISTKAGVLEEEARAINKPYTKYITTKIPYVTIKAAQTLDGKIATRTGDSRWITSDEARQYVHELRRKVDAVMVGAKTVIKDDPLLTSRASKGKGPLRIIVDSRLRTPLGARLLSSVDRAPVLIAAIKKYPRIKLYEKKGAEVLVVKSRRGMVDLRDLLKRLGEIGIAHIMVEGGGELIAGFLEEGLADKLLFFIAPKIIGGRDAVTSVEGEGLARIKDAVMLKTMKIKRFGEDILIESEVARCSRG